MKGIEVDSGAAREHPLIKELLGLIEETVGDGVLDFKDLQSLPFMKFWKYFIIYRYEEDKNDFRVMFYGTHVVSMYGADYTGMLFSEMDLAEAHDDLLKANLKVLQDRQLSFLSGSLFWQNRESRAWHQVKIPLQRDGKNNEILVCLDIS